MKACDPNDLAVNIFIPVLFLMTHSLNIFNRASYLAKLLVYDDCIQLNPATTHRPIALTYILIVTTAVFQHRLTLCRVCGALLLSLVQPASCLLVLGGNGVRKLVKSAQRETSE